MKTYLLHKATIVTAEKEEVGSIIISDGKICDIMYVGDEDFDYKIFTASKKYTDIERIELEGKYIIAGGIDAHVHFRDPGLTHKADIYTESRAAAAGGVTSVIDMPNTSPATVSAKALKDKVESVGNRSIVNIGFHIGATNSNVSEVKNILRGETEADRSRTGGVKVFMGSSTGNMLVDEAQTLDSLFSIKTRPILVHCEDEATIKNNLAQAIATYGDDIPFSEHENIRSRKACIKSSIKALEKAISHDTKLVLCHISTKEELEMVRAAKANNPKIYAETSCNYLWFTNDAYTTHGSKAKCNPSIKTEADRSALRAGLAAGLIDTIGSDHAPHLLSEKEGIYTKAPSGLPSIQQSLPVLITIAEEENIPLTRIAAVFSENASEIYGIKRGKIQHDYPADIVVFDKDKEFVVRNEEQYTKCGWSPYEGISLKGHIEMVFVNGILVISEGRLVTNDHNLNSGQLLEFN